MAIHIIPLNDTHEHIDDSTCKCEPDISTENGEMIFTHHSWDGREIIEELMAEFNPDEEDGMLEQCPHCGSIWGCEEMDFQECHCCGYPDADRPYDEDAWDDTEGAEWMDDDQDLPDFEMGYDLNDPFEEHDPIWDDLPDEGWEKIPGDINEDEDEDLDEDASPVCCGSCVNFVSTGGNAGFCKAMNMAGTGRYDVCAGYIEAH